MRSPIITPLTLAAALLTAGCGDIGSVWGNPQDRAKQGLTGLDIKPFEIGPASKWQTPELYLDYASSHQVALKSDHGMLVAILLVNPNTGQTVRYDSMAGLFRDPQDGSTYTTDGLTWANPDGRVSLARCRIRHLGPLDDPDVGLEVDPGKLYYQEQQQWSKAASNHLFIDTDNP